jgi:integrase
LPKSALTKEGWEYLPADTTWRLHDGGSQVWLNFNLYKPYCDETFLHALKLYLVHLVRRQALDSCYNFFSRFRLLVKFASVRRGVDVTTITSDDIVGYRATLSKIHEHNLFALRGLLREWVALGYPGVEPEASQALDSLKLRKNDTGVAVRNHDPVRGPFNEEEFQSITRFALDRFAQGKINLSDLALVFLFMAFGPRPVTFAALRLKDLVVTRDRHDIDQFTLSLPAAKRHRGGRRTHHDDRKLTPEYGRMLQALATQVMARFATEIAAGQDPLELPLFVGHNPATRYLSSSGDLYRKLMAIFEAVDPIICTRPGLEGQPLKIFPRRFRHTVATRLAEEGKRQREIAKALGHVALTSCIVYIEATAKIRHKINEKLAQELSPIAQYFLGQIVYSEADAVRGNDPSSRIRTVDGTQVVGSCGKTGFCGGFVPLPCYECPNFQPWVDAPHGEVLAWLLQDRERKFELTADVRYAAVNDELVKKVADVARRCLQLQEGKKEGGP